MGDSVQIASKLGGKNSNSAIAKDIEVESIKSENESIIKELETQVVIKPDLKEYEKPTISQLAEKKVKKEQSVEIDVSETLKPDNSDTKVKLTFKKKDFVKKEVSKKTADAPTEETTSSVSTKRIIGQDEPTTEEVRSQIIAAENTAKENFSVDDYGMIAEFIIDTLDWGGSSLLMWVAKDKTDTPYALQQSKKDRLKKQLTRILIKSNVKMNFTVLFILSLVLAYMKPIQEAIKNRQTIKKGEEELKRKKLEEIKRRKEKDRINALKDEARVDVVKSEKPKKVAVVKDETIKDEVKEVIKESTEEEKIVASVEEVVKEEKNDVVKKDDNKLTEDTKLDGKGNVVINRGRGNPKNRRHDKRTKS